MTDATELYAIEEGFWLAGREHFLESVDAECLLAFPQPGQMHGVYKREDIAVTASVPGRWRDLQMNNRQLHRPFADVAILSYRADVIRADGEPYSVLIGSGYVRRTDGWKLTFHQHSPVE
mgnify:CR=1 FL=1|jgi:hypothetical protein